jgi:plasmid maintenance system killer protein
MKTTLSGMHEAAIIDAAEELEDLRQPPSNRLEKLKGDRVEQHSIRSTINGGFAFAGRAERTTLN